MNRSEATISRELRRNKGLRGYRPKQANLLAETRRKTASKAVKFTIEVQDWIKQLITKELSPEQVCDYLRIEKGVQFHHETVYQFIYKDKAEGGVLWKHLRIASKSYRKRYGSKDKRGQIKNRVCIEKRPEIVDQRTRIGDWEGDTVIGKNRKSALLTMVERKSLYTIIVKLNGKNAEELADKAVKAMSSLKEQIKTITFDNGLEFAAHERIGKALEADIYFAHPYASWERGTNENTNGLIRQYFPKGTDFLKVSEQEIEFVMDRLNNRPRKTREHKSPNELFWGQRVDLLAA